MTKEKDISKFLEHPCLRVENLRAVREKEWEQVMGVFDVLDGEGERIANWLKRNGFPDALVDTGLCLFPPGKNPVPEEVCFLRVGDGRKEVDVSEAGKGVKIVFDGGDCLLYPGSMEVGREMLFDQIGFYEGVWNRVVTITETDNRGCRWRKKLDIQVGRDVFSLKMGDEGKDFKERCWQQPDEVDWNLTWSIEDSLKAKGLKVRRDGSMWLVLQEGELLRVLSGVFPSGDFRGSYKLYFAGPDCSGSVLITSADAYSSSLLETVVDESLQI
jgi:hypothetical protein